jgi:hypothetical protein
MKRMGQHRRMRAPEERARITELQDLLIERFWFAHDSALEGDGFEPSVPLYILTVSDPLLVGPVTVPFAKRKSPVRDRVPSVRRLLVWAFSCQAVFFGLRRVLCSEREGRSSSRRLRSGIAKDYPETGFDLAAFFDCRFTTWATRPAWRRM